ncbi:hypothetical protein DITRI_Ditri06bG0069300 [Diplodiscus trichospermus]
MEPKSLFSLRFEDVKEGHEELLKLSLSPPSSASSSPLLVDQAHQLPSSSLHSTHHHNLDSFPSTNPNFRKRLFSHSFDVNEEDQENLSLSLAPPAGSSSLQRRSFSPSPSPDHDPVRQVVGAGSALYQPRVRRNPFQTPKQGKSETIDAPYPWATTRRATVHDLNHLQSQGITMITGDLECNGCQETKKIEYNLEEKFRKIKDFVAANKSAMHDRAPTAWMNPRLDSCETCGYTLKPVVGKKREINWLFLLLGQMLGCCKLSELKYFCKHSKNHRTGAKDRLLYLTYLGLCKQLDPQGPFDV